MTVALAKMKAFQSSRAMNSLKEEARCCAIMRRTGTIILSMALIWSFKEWRGAVEEQNEFDTLMNRVKHMMFGHAFHLFFERWRKNAKEEGQNEADSGDQMAQVRTFRLSRALRFGVKEAGRIKFRRRALETSIFSQKGFSA